MRIFLLLLLAGVAWGAEVKKVHITPAACREHHLPAVDLAVDATGTALLPFEFPSPEVYLRMSGPPGGPLIFEVLARPGTLEQALDTRFPGTRREEQRPCQARLAGQTRLGVTFLVGQSLARTRWSVFELPSLAVMFGASPGGDPLSHPHLAPLAASLQVAP